eukprot:TRINITY_DN5237_c0_g1_i1.p1 TRINITY_DN5237_c0_g1~~TRINITY_DN5237_c0_g1_i1.p1  ORF type:complete len:168 (-),score=10.37 TRINITY_DN5237_c0_g1_i1:261-764(-)
MARGHWPDSRAGLQVEIESNGARVFGKAMVGKSGTINLKFPIQEADDIHQVFLKSNVSLSSEYDDLHDYVYDLFEDFLESEGLSHLGTLTANDLREALSGTECSEIIEFFEIIAVDTFEGLEDLDVKSAVLLENGCVGIDCWFDIRGVFFTMKIGKAQYKYCKKTDC